MKKKHLLIIVLSCFSKVIFAMDGIGFRDDIFSKSPIAREQDTSHDDPLRLRPVNNGGRVEGGGLKKPLVVDHDQSSGSSSPKSDGSTGSVISGEHTVVVKTPGQVSVAETHAADAVLSELNNPVSLGLLDHDNDDDGSDDDDLNVVDLTKNSKVENAKTIKLLAKKKSLKLKLGSIEKSIKDLEKKLYDSKNSSGDELIKSKSKLIKLQNKRHEILKKIRALEKEIKNKENDNQKKLTNPTETQVPALKPVKQEPVKSEPVNVEPTQASAIDGTRSESAKKPKKEKGKKKKTVSFSIPEEIEKPTSKQEQDAELDKKEKETEEKKRKQIIDLEAEIKKQSDFFNRLNQSDPQKKNGQLLREAEFKLESLKWQKKIAQAELNVSILEADSQYKNPKPFSPEAEKLREEKQSLKDLKDDYELYKEQKKFEFELLNRYN